MRRPVAPCHHASDVGHVRLLRKTVALKDLLSLALPRSPARIIKVTTHTRSIDVCIVPVLCEMQQEIPGFPTASFSLRCTWLGLARRPGKGRWSSLPMNTIPTDWGARIKITTAVHITTTNDWRLRICSTSSYQQSCTYYQISYMQQYNVCAWLLQTLRGRY